MGELPPIGNITKWRNSALGKSLHHQMAAFRLLEERKTPEIPPFLLRQTEISPLLAKSPLWNPSVLRSDAKFRQNGVTHGPDCQNRPERPNFRRLTHHAQKQNLPNWRNLPQNGPQNHRRILNRRPNSITPWGQRGLHSTKTEP